MSERDAWQGHTLMDHVPGVPGVTEADVLRRYADRLAAVHGVADARAAIEHHLRVRTPELGLVGLDIREDHAEEGVGTLRIRYAQHHRGLPVLGAGIEVTADIASASVIAVHSTLDELEGAPEPRSAQPRWWASGRATSVTAPGLPCRGATTTPRPTSCSGRAKRPTGGSTWSTS